jgi:hypothetical protein
VVAALFLKVVHDSEDGRVGSVFIQPGKLVSASNNPPGWFNLTAEHAQCSFRERMATPARRVI